MLLSILSKRAIPRLLRTSRLVSPSSGSRSFCTSRPRRDIFTIQDEDDFTAKVLENKEPVIVDFNATWCGPCKMLTPRLEAVIAATEGKVHLAMVDIDDHADLAIDHGVQAVPTVVAFKDGKMKDKFVGLLDEDKLQAFVKKLQG